MKKRILFAGIFACITALFLMTGCPHHSSSGGWYLPGGGGGGGGGEGQITNADVKIVRSEGLLNSAYVIFEQIPNAEYTVLIDGKELDEQLIRYYDTYTYYEASESNGQTTWTKKTRSNVVRADALGLKAESHTMQVAVKGSTSYSTATMIVADHDRSGFAFTGSTTPGAYNKDGTLKDNAIVVYADNSNFNTVTLTVKKNAKGETTTFTGVQEMVDTSGYWKVAEYNGNSPLCIRIIGTVDLTGFPSSNWGSTKEGLQVKSNNTNQKTIATIEGVGHDATLHGFGILARNSQYLEIQNLALMNFKDDGISLDTGNLYTWIHNLDIFYGGAGSDKDQKKGDGSLDVKGDSKWQTYSYNHFWDSGKMSLCGMDEESGPNYITYHHNWFDHSDSRHPRIRTMSVHVYNNYYDGNSKYGAGATTGADAFVEGNYFRNVKYPMLSSMQGNDVYAGTNVYKPNDGTFSGESGGSIKSWNNKIVDTNKNTSYWPHKNSKTAPLITKGATGSLPSGVDTAVHFDAWEASSRNEKVPASVKAVAGEDTYSNFDTTENLGLSIAPTDPDAAKKNVIDYAGRHTPDFAWTFDNASEDTNYDVNTTLQNALVGYKSGLKKAQGTGGSGTGGGSGTTTPGGDSGNTGGNTGGGTTDPTPPAEVKPEGFVAAGSYGFSTSATGFDHDKIFGSNGTAALSVLSAHGFTKNCQINSTGLVLKTPVETYGKLVFALETPLKLTFTDTKGYGIVISTEDGYIGTSGTKTSDTLPSAEKLVLGAGTYTVVGATKSGTNIASFTLEE